MKLNTKPLNDVDYGFVVLAKGSYVARIKVTVEPNKDKTGKNLVVKHQIMDELVENSKGEKVENRGQIYVTRWVALQAKEGSDYDPNRTIKELGVAAGIDCDNEDVTTEALEGAIVSVRLAVREPEGTFDESNDVKGWSEPSDEQREIADDFAGRHPF